MSLLTSDNITFHLPYKLLSNFIMLRAILRRKLTHFVFLENITSLNQRHFYGDIEEDVNN